MPGIPPASFAKPLMIPYLVEKQPLDHMKKYSTLFVLGLVCLLFSAASIQAQVPGLTIHPEHHPSQSITTNDAGELYIMAKNTSANTITLDYELVSDTYNPAWTLLFCDHGLCFTSLRQAGTMDPIPAGDSVMIYKVSLNTQGVADSGTATYRFWDSANSSNEDTISITFYVEQAVGIEDEEIAQQVRLFPQPVSSELYLDLPASFTNVQADVYDLSGSRVLSSSLSGFATLDVSTLPTSMYILELSNEKYTVRKRFAVSR